MLPYKVGYDFHPRLSLTHGELGVGIGDTGIGRGVTARRVPPGELDVGVDDSGLVSGGDRGVTSVRRTRFFPPVLIPPAEATPAGDGNGAQANA